MLPSRLGFGRTVAIAAAAAGAVLWLMPVPQGLSPGVMTAAGLAVATLGLLATGALPEYLAVLMFFLGAMLLKAAPPDVVFSGFASAALWLVLSGLVVGAAIRHTGLGQRLARPLAVVFGGSYFKATLGVVVISVGLAFVMPSTMGRLALLVPIVLAFADRLGFAEGGRGRTGLVITVTMASFAIPCTILPANIPNMVLVGAAETQHGIKLTYLDYLGLHFPVLGVLKGVLLVVLAAAMFREPVDPTLSREIPPSPPPSTAERGLMVLLALALAFWATDVWHGISPAWVSLATAVICLLPGLGLLPPNAFNEKVNFGSVLYLAGILGLGAMIESSGLGGELSRLLLLHLPLAPGADLQNFLGFTGIGIVLGLATTMPNIPALLSPLAPALAEQSGWPLTAVLMVQVVSFSTLVLPYQAPPVIVGLAMGGVPTAQSVRLCLTLAAATLLLLVPIDFLWWLLLGWPGRP